MAELGDSTRILLGLQQTGNELHFIGADQTSGFFQADMGLEPGRQDVAVLVPPAGRARLPGQGELILPLLVVRYAVESE